MQIQEPGLTRSVHVLLCILDETMRKDFLWVHISNAGEPLTIWRSSHFVEVLDLTDFGFLEPGCLLNGFWFIKTHLRECLFNQQHLWWQSLWVAHCVCWDLVLSKTCSETWLRQLVCKCHTLVHRTPLLQSRIKQLLQKHHDLESKGYSRAWNYFKLILYSTLMLISVKCNEM